MFSLQAQLQNKDIEKDVANKMKKLRQKKIRNGGVEQTGLKNGNSLQKWMESCLKNIMLIHHQ